MAILQVFPHCDIHLALDNATTKSIDFRVFRYLAGTPFVLDDVTATCTAQLLAPHEPVGSRLKSFVNINLAAKTITATAVGTNLVIFQRGDSYITVRIQVHQDILAWWFGNGKMTAALDATHAQTQPSIYAMFSDDATGTDRVGDITGHGFVSLATSDATIFTVANANQEGRIRGIKEGTANLQGAFLGINHSLEVEVVDYTKTRDLLVPVRAGDLTKASELHNMLFLAEGFTSAEEAKFDKLVTRAAKELFTKPRHEPYGTLQKSFNVFKAFTPSKEALVTCGFQVTDNAVNALGKGHPIPWEYTVSNDDTDYEVSELVAKVGLPKRGESRNEAQLKALWNSQSLDDFDDGNVDAHLVEAWKNSHSLGFLEARNTFFGMMLGGRWADNTSGSGAAIPTPAADNASAQLKAFVKRAYEFYQLREGGSRTVSMDPRRNAPETMLSGNESRTCSFMRFLGGLRMKKAPHQALGTEWVPDGTFKRSRGLIAMIINEHMDGGTNLNESTVTANAIQEDLVLTANHVASANANIKVMRRVVPQGADFKADLSSAINTIAHEFGHSFNLDDEYESSRGDQPTFGDDEDNIAALQSIFADPNWANNNSRKIDVAKVKWASLPRIKLAARLTAALSVNNQKIEVMIDRREAKAWVARKNANERAHLRKILITPKGKQLPLSSADADHMTDLTIDSVDVATGKIVLTPSGPGALAPPPVFPAGSVLFVPHRENNAVRTIVEAKVLAELILSDTPLNKDTDTATVNDGPDYPRDIADFKPPCSSARLVGIFEGGGTWTGLVYRPTGTCKMRSGSGKNENGQFCHVCKWLITNRVDPGKHHVVDKKFYPEAKKNG